MNFFVICNRETDEPSRNAPLILFEHKLYKNLFLYSVLIHLWK